MTAEEGTREEEDLFYRRERKTETRRKFMFVFACL